MPPPREARLIRILMLVRFIWVRYQIDKICIEKTRKGVLASLDELSVGLNEMYSYLGKNHGSEWKPPH